MKLTLTDYVNIVPDSQKIPSYRRPVGSSGAPALRTIGKTKYFVLKLSNTQYMKQNQSLKVTQWITKIRIYVIVLYINLPVKKMNDGFKDERYYRVDNTIQVDKDLRVEAD